MGLFMLCSVGAASLAAAAGFLCGRAVGDREIDWWRRQCEALGAVLRDNYRSDDALWREVDRPSTGAPLLQLVDRQRDGKTERVTNWRANWAYDGRWGGLAGIELRPGDTVYVFLVAGNTRSGWAPEFRVRERSNVMAVRLVDGDRWAYADAVTTPPPPVTVPPPVIVDGGGGTVVFDVAGMTRTITELQRRVDALEQLAHQGAELSMQLHTFQELTQKRLDWLENRVLELWNRPVADGCTVPFLRCRVGAAPPVPLPER
jgi:hypothetical protein